MKSSHNVYRTGFGDQSFEIDCNNDDAYSIAQFLFLDFPGATSDTPTKRFTIQSSGSKPMLSLSDDDKRHYLGTSRYQLAYTLMNEVIFYCIDTNSSQHALHAGAVHRGDRCIILPGKSGNGKSTLTCWLIMNGFRYLTDELVFLNPDAQVSAMTRPVSLKVNASHKSWLLTEDHRDIVTSESGSMIPHRLLNPDFSIVQPKITDVIFPEFRPEAERNLQEISPAKSSLYLLQSHVNARNLSGHGVSELASIIKQCRSYTLSYGCFDDLRQIFCEGSELFS